MNDGLAERKPKPKTSAAVANRIAPGKEHFKHMFLQFIGDTETVIADAYFSHIFSRDCRDPDVRASRSIFDCVVHQVDKHLHDESCIDNICTFCAKALFLELCVYYKTLAGELHPRTC